MRAILGSLLVLLTSTVSLTARSPETPNHLSLYFGRCIDANLLEVLPKLLSGDLTTDDASILSVAYFRDFYTLPLFGRENKLLFSYGGTLSVHPSYNLEGTINIRGTLREILPENDYVDMDFSAATGLSYVWGDLDYEDGTLSEPDKKYRFQSSEIFQLDIYPRRNPATKFFFRLHHRSGMYGLIAPRRVGSNFLGAGFSWSY